MLVVHLICSIFIDFTSSILSFIT